MSSAGGPTIGLLRRSALKVDKLPRRNVLWLYGILRLRCVTALLLIKLVLVLHINYTSFLDVAKSGGDCCKLPLKGPIWPTEEGRGGVQGCVRMPP